jgi:hypothetical protein
MKKSKIIFKLFILFFSITVFSQVEAEKFNEDALVYLNTFLSDEGWAMKVEGNFTYNRYSNSLAFKSEIEIDDKKNTVRKVEYVLSLENIKNIEEIIYKEKNIIGYKINLRNEIYYKTHTIQKGDIIPQFKNKKRSSITLNIHKALSDGDFKNIQNVIRDVFFDIPIETKNYKL